MITMWIDEHGSDVLEWPECRRLLALGAKEQLHGHLGVIDGDSPLVLPVNYTTSGPDVIIRVGDGVIDKIEGARMVGFQVDGEENGRLWSVLVRGLATEEHDLGLEVRLPSPQVSEPGHRVVRIRSDVITGRRLGVAPV